MADSVEKKIRLHPPVEKLSQKSFTRVFLNRSHRSSHHQTHTHTATWPHTHMYQVPHCSIIQGADAGVTVTAVAPRSKSAWRIPSSARQQRVSHDAAARGIDPMLPTPVAPAVALAALG